MDILFSLLLLYILMYFYNRDFKFPVYILMFRLTHFPIIGRVTPEGVFTVSLFRLLNIFFVSPYLTFVSLSNYQCIYV